MSSSFNFDKDIPTNDLETAKYLLYEKKVRQLTEKTFRKEWITGKQLRGKGYVLDHRLSISDCYKNQVPVDIAAHHCNLEIITEEENRRKGKQSSITFSELIIEITENESS